MRNSFIFYSSYYDAISELPEEEQGLIYKAIIDYAIAKKEPKDLTPACRMCFKLIKPTIDAALSRYDASVENGKKGGAPKGNNNAQKQPRNKQKTTQKQPKNNPETTEKQAKINLDMDMDMDMVKDLDVNSNKPSNDGRLVGSIEALEILNAKLDDIYRHYEEKNKDLFGDDSRYFTRLHDLFEKMSYTKELTINGIKMQTDKVMWEFLDIFRRNDDDVINLILDCFGIVDNNMQIANVFSYTVSVFYNKMKGI